MTSTDTNSTIRLTSAHPLVWEDPTTLRVGFDRAIARVDVASADAQRIMSLLAAGTSRAALDEVNAEVAKHLLGSLQPALVIAPPRVRSAPRDAARAAAAGKSPGSAASRSAPISGLAQTASVSAVPRSTPTAAVSRDAPIRARMSDDGRSVPWLRAALEADDLCAFPREPRLPELAIEVLRYLEPLGRSSRWQRQGVPLLLVRFTDDFVRVGPIVHPGGAPCHGCEALHLTDRDPALGVIAAQLIGGTPSTERAAVASFASALATHLIGAWRRGERWVHHHQLILPVRAGRAARLPTSVQLTPHPECGCAITARSQPPPRSARASAPPAPRSQTPTAEANHARA